MHKFKSFTPPPWQIALKSSTGLLSNEKMNYVHGREVKING